MGPELGAAARILVSEGGEEFLLLEGPGKPPESSLNFNFGGGGSQGSLRAASTWRGWQERPLWRGFFYRAVQSH